MKKSEIIDLIKAGNVDVLTQIRDGYTRHLPIEIIHIEDRECFHIIDEYLKDRIKLISLVEERAALTETEGLHNIAFEEPSYLVVAVVNVTHYTSPGDYWTPGCDEYKTDIIEIEITPMQYD
jgi:hypothetical protein